MKVLLALLDEEALASPSQNKADLLSEDQPVLSGAEGTCILNLFRLAQTHAVETETCPFVFLNGSMFFGYTCSHKL